MKIFIDCVFVAFLLCSNKNNVQCQASNFSTEANEEIDINVTRPGSSEAIEETDINVARPGPLYYSTRGEPWPKPQLRNLYNDTFMIVRPPIFRFQVSK